MSTRTEYVKTDIANVVTEIENSSYKLVTHIDNREYKSTTIVEYPAHLYFSELVNVERYRDALTEHIVKVRIVLDE